MSNLEDARELFTKGLLELERGNLELSKAFFKKVIAIKSDHIPSLINIVHILMNQKRLNEAADFSKNILKLDVNVPDANLCLGLHFLESNNVALAKNHFEKVLDLIPNHQISMKGLLTSEIRLGAKVTVVLINRNLHTWPASMIKRIEAYDSLHEIIVIDHQSSSQDTLNMYSTLKHRVIYEKNLGHTSPWVENINQQIKTNFYVVSDPDLDLSRVPNDCLDILKSTLCNFPELEKIGLGLDVESVPIESPYYSHVNSYEKSLWELPLLEGIFRLAPVDTTFAIYHKRVMNHYKVCGARLNFPYVANHIPWTLKGYDEEFAYYLKEANSSSSYKTFLGL
ncbi:hypothetical protein AOC10_09820 [Polynucleobacter asymbioticus]|jgi:tetratricopeptide (TPR) repeat protein|uniref:tetratricopeptide repeat protein n=1 Tax=Polynucleobacter asymbioticus TaxID=576611 RepID=UPI0008FB163A|nr:hypothetical protein [Polynucleobacter asymbioticus]APC06814.1 hypothetical protein AOC10_09820 [Polynucleobacter asymbioticus]